MKQTRNEAITEITDTLLNNDTNSFCTTVSGSYDSEHAFYF